MKITGIDTVMVDYPGRKWTIVQVHTDEGTTGFGEATYTNKKPVVCPAVEHMKPGAVRPVRPGGAGSARRPGLLPPASPGAGLGVELDMDGVERHRWRP